MPTPEELFIVPDHGSWEPGLPDQFGWTDIRPLWAAYRCTYGTSGEFFGRTPVFAQNPEHRAALEAAHFGAGYVPTSGGYIGSRRNCPSGIGGKTCQTNGTDCSSHNYGLAWDIEYNYNPHFKRKLTEADLLKLHAEGKTKYTPGIVADILSVKTTKGSTMFRWLGYIIGDTMHWEVNIGPDDQDIDWSTIPGEDMTNCPWKDNVDKGEDWYTNYPPCSNHHSTDDAPLVWRVNTGVCAVPSWSVESIDWAVNANRLNVRDTSRDDFRSNLTDGRYWALEYRARNA